MPNDEKEEELNESSKQKNADSEKAPDFNYAQKMRERMTKVDQIKKGKEVVTKKTILHDNFRQKSIVIIGFQMTVGYLK